MQLLRVHAIPNTVTNAPYFWYIGPSHQHIVPGEECPRRRQKMDIFWKRYQARVLPRTYQRRTTSNQVSRNELLLLFRQDTICYQLRSAKPSVRSPSQISQVKGACAHLARFIVFCMRPRICAFACKIKTVMLCMTIQALHHVHITSQAMRESRFGVFTHKIGFTICGKILIKASHTHGARENMLEMFTTWCISTRLEKLIFIQTLRDWEE